MSEHFDIIVVGAGISGIGAGVHLGRNCPGRSYLILEARQRIGGTWDLFRYPGIRSDSDMYTLGFNFRPWTSEKAIADGASILAYLEETAREYGVLDHLRFGHRLESAHWDSVTARWTLDAVADGKPTRFSCNFLYMCSGYYDYEHAYTPEFPGLERFAGSLIHPQHWPRDIDYRGKRVVVIGSGATAMTLVPEMARDAAEVVMLQRSPTWVISRPGTDRFAKTLYRVLPGKLAHWLLRWRNILLQQWVFWFSRRHPQRMKSFLLREVRRQLGRNFDVQTHFQPRYKPWEQRLCLIQDGDLFRMINAGKVRMITDNIETFTENGIRLVSGTELEADIVVTATGLNLLFMAGVKPVVDGKEIDFHATFGYRGMMFSGVPNLACAFGYTNASWTLKADLSSEYVCRLLNYMAASGYATAVPVPSDPEMRAEKWVDFSSGYIERAQHRFPKQGSRVPWKLHQNYLRDLLLLRYGRLDDGELRFSPLSGDSVAATADASS